MGAMRWKLGMQVGTDTDTGADADAGGSEEEVPLGG